MTPPRARLASTEDAARTRSFSMFRTAWKVSSFTSSQRSPRQPRSERYFSAASNVNGDILIRPPRDVRIATPSGSTDTISNALPAFASGVLSCSPTITRSSTASNAPIRASYRRRRVRHACRAPSS
jgi:hypothetical protein